jgi:hypothetical protein
MSKKKGRYAGRTLSSSFVLELLLNGSYRVDLDTGTIYGRNGKPLKTRLGGRTEQYWKVYLYADNHRREMPVSHVVWMAGAKR